MGKKKQVSSLGRSIIRDRFGSKGRRHADSYLHTSEINDGYDWNKLNLRSVTEESSLDDFLATAEMAGIEFTAEKLNIKFVSQEARVGLLSPEEERKICEAQDKHRELLSIPRRPHWDKTTTAADLDLKERESFLEWRRKLAQLQEIEGLVLTPFEKNLEFWRQLWRVIERSDIIVQIVDGRNPLLFRSEDLERYVHEVDPDKLNLILVNKADYLTDKQREMWASYFDGIGVRVAFWSAVAESERLKEETKTTNKESSSHQEQTHSETSDEEQKHDETGQERSGSCEAVSQSVSDDSKSETNKKEETDCTTDSCDNSNTEYCLSHEEEAGEEPTSASPLADGHLAESALKLSISNDNQSDSHSNEHQNHDENCLVIDSNESQPRNNPKVLNGLELIQLFKSLHKGKKYTEGITTIGMVGYPNVGKSSTINALLQTKKVPVSATPGRTKHFQTLYLDKTLMLCDCPGLVMPSFVNTKADMVISGILPIDQMRDYVAPVAAVCRLIPRSMLENIYGIMIPKPREGEDENRPPTPHELLGAYGYMRGYMTHKGIPDYQRAARHILKDFVNGKLLYCTPPPGCDVNEFHPTPSITKATKERAHPQPQPIGSKAKQTKNVPRKYDTELDRQFFEKNEPRIRMRGVRGGVLGISSSEQGFGATASQTSVSGKPWKKHYNHKRKEKLRRITSHFDA